MSKGLAGDGGCSGSGQEIKEKGTNVIVGLVSGLMAIWVHAILQKKNQTPSERYTSQLRLPHLLWCPHSEEPHLLRESLFHLGLDSPYFLKNCLVGDEVLSFWPDTVLQVKSSCLRLLSEGPYVST